MGMQLWIIIQNFSADTKYQEGDEEMSITSAKDMSMCVNDYLFTSPDSAKEFLKEDVTGEEAFQEIKWTTIYGDIFVGRHPDGTEYAIFSRDVFGSN